MKTSLGIWALGSMVTRFVPGGYQPQWAGETTAERVRRAVDGLGDLIDGYEFHYPQELNEENLDEVREALDGHDIYCVATGLHLDPRFGKGGLVVAGRRDARGGRAADARGDRLRRASSARTSSSGPGSRATTTRSRRRTRESWAWLVDGIGQAARALPRPRDPALPRAQELGARDEDPHAQHRDDAARDPQAARAGPRQRQGQHGLAAPDHERREPRRVRGAARRRGAARTPARELGWGTFDDDNMVGATAFMETLELAVELRRAGYGENGERLGFDLYPYTEDAVEAVRRSVLQWRFIDCVAARIDDAALREAQMRKDAVRAYELVYAALGAGDAVARRARRRHDRRQGDRDLARRARWSRRGGGVPALDAAARLGGAGPRGLVARGRGGARRARRRAGGDRALRPDARARLLDERDRVLRPAILWNDQRTAAECAEIEERVGLERLIELTGNRALTGFTAPKLLWLRRHEPEIGALGEAPSGGDGGAVGLERLIALTGNRALTGLHGAEAALAAAPRARRCTRGSAASCCRRTTSACG